MKEKLTNNLGLKIISVFLAFFVWLAVVNISNPEVSDYQEVPLEILNEGVLEANNLSYEIVGGKSTVTVSYKVQTLDTGTIKPSDFRAYIDLAEMYEPTGAVAVKVDVLHHKNLLIGQPVARPGVIRVSTEELQRKRFDLQVMRIGTTEEGYKAGTATISPTYVYVSGPVSKVGQISTVGIEIDVDNANSNRVGTATPKFYDANGNQLVDLENDDRVTLNHSEVDYELAILKEKRLALDLKVEGRVADGFRYTGVESSVNSVGVVGLKSTLADVSTLTIPPSVLDMDGATGDKQVTIDLTKYLPSGIQLADDESKEITVTIKVEPLESRTYVLHTSQIKQVGASSQYEYEYDRNTINVVIRGLKEDLDQLTADQFGAEIDVSEMLPGENEGEVTFQAFFDNSAYEVVFYDHPQITVQEVGPGAGTGETDEGESAAEETTAAD
ncbi:MAG: hypothetical protein KH230_17795 [Enterocloster asparagiformis]|nr:hypothetical protein [Enterocloster asparagiformis]